MGVDFIGIGTEDESYVFGTINLDSLHVELSKCNSQHADVVLRYIRDNILFKHGTPEIINCDHARELVGKTMQKLSKKFDVKNTQHRRSLCYRQFTY